jgi:WD40 repeat protein
MITIEALLFVAQTYREHATLKGHAVVVDCVGFSSDSKMLATGSRDGVLKIWNVADARERSTLRGHEASVRSVRFAANGTSLTSIASGGEMVFWDRVEEVYKPRKTQTLPEGGNILHFDQQVVTYAS